MREGITFEFFLADINKRKLNSRLFHNSEVFVFIKEKVIMHSTKEIEVIYDIDYGFLS